MESKIISSELLGIDLATTLVNGKAYVMTPPSIKTLSLVGKHLGELGEGQDIGVILSMTDRECRAKALSCLIRGDVSLADELSLGTDEELTNGIVKGIGFVEIRTAGAMSASAKQLSNLIARPYR